MHCVNPFFPYTSETGQMFFLHCLIATFNILKLQFISDQNNGIFLRKSKVFSLTDGKNQKGFTWIISNHFDEIRIQASLIMSCTIGYKKFWRIIIYFKMYFFYSSKIKVWKSPKKAGKMHFHNWFQLILCARVYWRKYLANSLI